MLAYSSSTAYIVIVMVALAEELLALARLLVTSLSGMVLSISEVLVSEPTNTGKPASITTRVIKGISLFIGTVWLDHHSLSVK